MNLIEQLGGYEKSKMELKLKEEDSIFQCCTAITADMIRNALLEYRRQHNIFEMRDKIVYLSNIAPEHNDIYDVWKVDLIYFLVAPDGMDYRVVYDQIRHATDAEIEVGHRL